MEQDDACGSWLCLYSPALQVPLVLSVLAPSLTCSLAVISQYMG